jgi:hypothetical protein
MLRMQTFSPGIYSLASRKDQMMFRMKGGDVVGRGHLDDNDNQSLLAYTDIKLGSVVKFSNFGGG